MTVGRLEGITGPMYCGKTEELLRRCQRYRIGGRKVQLLTPTLDDRRGFGRVVSNGGRRIEDYGLTPTPVNTLAPLATSIELNTEVVGIDEVQFFNEYLPRHVATERPHPFGYRIVEEIKLQVEVLGRVVIWSGLDMNSRGEPFGPVPFLLAVTPTVTKLTAVCQRCGSHEATHTTRLVKDEHEILVGAEREYAARCLDCYLKEQT